METVTVVGVDLAKSVFQVHALDGAGKPVIRRAIRRGAMLKFFNAELTTVAGQVRDLLAKAVEAI